ncbi:hypothetical protein KC19_8G101700 [Ceratodon purpureus]|uniref:Uncharacterized protein n=1 Tax=Ceratodon purpureus TaxID=3225 RepID=A0A8T0GZ37_CERPU|nr:hypothetical protein KC19_8G101700 [Ceratodon purpureus]
MRENRRERAKERERERAPSPVPKLITPHSPSPSPSPSPLPSRSAVASRDPNPPPHRHALLTTHPKGLHYGTSHQRTSHPWGWLKFLLYFRRLGEGDLALSLQLVGCRRGQDLRVTRLELTIIRVVVSV